MQILKRAAFVMPALCFNVRRMGFAWRRKQPYMNGLSGNVQLRAPLFCLRMPRHPEQPARFVVTSGEALILRVDGGRGVSQVCDAVVRLDAIDMVKPPNRVVPVKVKPGESMRGMAVPIYTNDDVAASVSDPGRSSNKHAAACNLAPRKHAGFWRVIKHFAQSLRGKIGLSHDAVLSQSGQRPASITSAARALAL